MKKIVIAAAGAILLAGCQPAEQVEEKTTEMPTETAKQSAKFERLKALEMPTPVAKTVLHEVKHHGITYTDPYHWLKDPSYPVIDDKEVLDYLDAENDYFYSFLKPHAALKETLFQEFKGRVDETEESVPWVVGGYEYRWFYQPGQNYRTWSRINLETKEQQVFLNEPSLAEGKEYFVLGSWDISPDNRLLAYTVDTSGDEKYELYVQDLTTGLMLSDSLTNISSSVRFAGDNESLIYGQLQADRWYIESINSHTLGTQQSEDKVLLAESDEGFFLSFNLTTDKQFLVLSSGQAEITEHYVAPADLSKEPVLLAGRDKEFSYSVEHAHGDFYIRANDTHKNFRLAKVSNQAPSYENWETVIEGSDDFHLKSVRTLDKTMVLTGRNKGVDQILFRDYQGDSNAVPFPESVFTANIGNNPDFAQTHVRINYESMITPDSVYDVAISDMALTLRKQKKIPSGYDKTQYETKRIMAKARDGVDVPVSLVYKKGFKKDGSQPLFLYGYGAYGSAVNPTFSTLRTSLLDRGFAFAIAHVRGGDLMGYQWYLDGKLDKRTNTFNDFVDVARHLVKEDYVAEGNISIAGRSAGGELMGAVVIQAPELWRSVVLGVPFVDVLNTMLDESLPLTPPEWKEWGNPIETKHYFELLRSYSPYDNIEKREYPPMLVTGGLNDPRVTYWEPAKWTARMRANKTDDNLLLMRINMGAGHFANSGRYGRLKDFAEEYAFTLLAHGIDK